MSGFLASFFQTPLTLKPCELTQMKVGDEITYGYDGIDTDYQIVYDCDTPPHDQYAESGTFELEDIKNGIYKFSGHAIIEENYWSNHYQNFDLFIDKDYKYCFYKNGIKSISVEDREDEYSYYDIKTLEKIIFRKPMVYDENICII